MLGSECLFTTVLRHDTRGQAVQVGAVLLLGIVVIAFSGYQATVVPQQNEGLELRHAEQVGGEMAELRNAVVNSVGGDAVSSVAVKLGTTYPSRAVGANPTPPAGTLRTVGVDNPAVGLTLDNVSAEGETADYWNGTRRTYSSGVIVYEHSHNYHHDAPTVVYDNTVLYDQFSGANRTETGQTMVNGDELSLIAVNGSLNERGVSRASVDITTVSSSAETVAVPVGDSDDRLNVTLTTKLPRTEWRTLLDAEFDTDPGPDDGDETYLRNITQRPGPAGFYNVSFVFERGATYRLQLSKVGIQSNIDPEGAAYLAVESGEGATVQRGLSEDLQVAVRDRFNNPVACVTANGSVAAGSGGNLTTNRTQTDEDGLATFTYSTNASTATGTQQVNFSLQQTVPAHDEATPTNATLNVTVETTAGGGSGGGGGGASAGGSPDNDSTCVRNVSATGGSGGSSALSFDLKNQNACGGITMTDFSIDTPANDNGNVKDIDYFEYKNQGNSGNGQGNSGQNHEVNVTGSASGYAEATEETDTGQFDTDGKYYNFTAELTTPSNGNINIKIKNAYKDGNKAKLTYDTVGSSSDADITVSLLFTDGSKKEIHFEVSKVNT